MEIVTLIRLLNDKRLIKYEFENGPCSFTSLYKRILTEDVKTVDDVLALTKYTSTSDSNFKMFFSRFKKRALVPLLLLEDNAFKNPRINATYKSDRFYFLANTLMHFGMYKLSRSYIRKALAVMKMYDLNNHKVDLMMKDFQISCMIENKVFWYDYKKDYNHALCVKQKLNEGRILYSEIKHLSRTLGVTSLKKELGTIKRKQNQITQLAESCDNVDLNEFNYYAKALVLELENNYDELIELCELRIEQLKAQKFTQNKDLYGVYVRLLFTAVFKGDYKIGRRYAGEIISILDKHTYNYLYFLEYYFLLAMHTKNYVKAYKIYEEALAHPRFRKLPKLMRKKWGNYELFLVYALVTEPNSKTKFIDRLNQHALGKKSISTNKVLKSLLAGSSKGDVATEMIIEILYAIENKQKNKAIEKICNLEKLAYKLNRRKDALLYKRLYWFSKSLSVLVKKRNQFNEAAIESKKYLDNLQNIPLDINNIDSVYLVEVEPLNRSYKRIVKGLEDLL